MLVENCQFEPTPPLFGASAGVTLSEFRKDFWHQKTRVPGLSYGSLHDPSFSRYGTVPACNGQTGRQMDGRTAA